MFFLDNLLATVFFETIIDFAVVQFQFWFKSSVNLSLLFRISPGNCHNADLHKVPVLAS